MTEEEYEEKKWGGYTPDKFRERYGLWTSTSINGGTRLMSNKFLAQSSYQKYNYRYYSQRGQRTQRITHVGDFMKNLFKWTPMETPLVFYFPSSWENVIHVCCFKEGTKYFINGFRVLKSTMHQAFNVIANMVRRFESQEEFDAYLGNYLSMDPKVRQAIIDKVLYKFWNDAGEKVETLLTIQPIGPKEIAIELNPGTWVPLSVGKFKSFMNSYTRKNKFSFISPEELYYVSTGKVLSESDRKMTHAFLEQNRKSALRERRSLELIEDLSNRFKGKVYGYDVGNVTSNAYMKENIPSAAGMFIRGKQSYWAVVARAMKNTGRQDVSTYHLSPIEPENLTINSSNNYGRFDMGNEHFGLYYAVWNEDSYLAKRHTGVQMFCAEKEGKTVYFYARGPICIDNQENDVSIGDQLAGRALALINDVHSIRNVSTLRGMDKYATEKEGCLDGLSNVRFAREEDYKPIEMRFMQHVSSVTGKDINVTES